MPSTVYLNGSFLPRDRAAISVDDRGFLFGDGVYEVTRVVQGRLIERERHLARLQSGLAELQIAPAPDTDELTEISMRLLAENGLMAGEATVYMQVTRGVAPRTHHFPPASTPPTIYVSALSFAPAVELRARGASALTYPDLRWARCDIKTVNLLPNVLAKQHAVAAGVTEAILVKDGVVTEGSHTNVFGVAGGELRTHPLTHRILPGVTRAVVLEVADALGLTVDERPLRLDEIGDVEELFLTGTSTDVMPVVQIDGRRVGNGRPGPIAKRLYEGLMERWESAGEEARVPSPR
jgi:D-alanine transaminase